MAKAMSAMVWSGTSLCLVMTSLFLVCPAPCLASYAESLSLMFACTEEFPFYMSRLPWDCQQYVVCYKGDVVIQRCPAGMVFSQLKLVCDWPSSADIRRCYRSMEGYVRASCAQRKPHLLPNPDSCALFIDCRHTQTARRHTEPEADMMHSYVFECPYPSLFSTVTRKCADFREVQHHCHERPVPKAPCDYLQYRQSTPSLQACHLRHPSCVGKRDGFHPVALTRLSTLYAKRCFRERTVDVISCNRQLSSSMFSKRNASCIQHVYDVS